MVGGGSVVARAGGVLGEPHPAAGALSGAEQPSEHDEIHLRALAAPERRCRCPALVAAARRGSRCLTALRIVVPVNAGGDVVGDRTKHRMLRKPREESHPPAALNLG